MSPIWVTFSWPMLWPQLMAWHMIPSSTPYSSFISPKDFLLTSCMIFWREGCNTRWKRCFGFHWGKGYFTLDTLNKVIEEFKYGYTDSKDKPASISLSSSDHSIAQGGQSSHYPSEWPRFQCPFLHSYSCSDVVPVGDKHWQNYLELLTIVDYVFAPVVFVQCCGPPPWHDPSPSWAILPTLLRKSHKPQATLHHPHTWVDPEVSMPYTLVLCWNVVNICMYIMCIIHVRNIHVWLFYRVGPLNCHWYMHFEAKQSYFKWLAKNFWSFRNIAKTMASRHQRLMCYHLNSTGEGRGFFQQTVVTGKGEDYM